MVKLRGSRLLPTPGLPRLAKATNSLSTMRVPRRLPTVRLSFHDTPMAQAIGRKIVPRRRSRLAGTTERASPCHVNQRWAFAHPKTPLISATRAMNAMSIPATFSDRCRPSIAPRPAASMMFTSCFGTSAWTSPPVFGLSVSGTMILAIMMAPGAVMITAVSR